MKNEQTSNLLERKIVALIAQLSVFRREAGLSQRELAEKMGMG